MPEEIAGAAASVKAADNGATTISGRAEALKSIAGDVLKSFDQLPETVVAAPKAEEASKAGEKPTDVLSQTVAGTKSEAVAEPAWSPEQTAWFDKMAAAKSPEEQTAAQAEQPEFSEDQRTWLESQEEAAGGEQPAGEDHLAGETELKGKLDVKTQASINARIGKEVAKTKAAQEKAEQLETKVAELTKQLETKPVAGPALADGPLATVQTREQLQAEVQRMEQAVDQADELLAQLESDPGGVEAIMREAKIALKGTDGAEDFSPAAMTKYLKSVRQNADRMLRREVPKRVDYLKQVDAYGGEVLNLLPELKDKASPRNKAYWQILTEAPWLKNMPAWPRMAGIYMLGLEAYQQLQAKGKAPAAVVKAKRPVPVTIPSPRGMQPATTRARPTTNSNDLATAALNGDKKARLQYIQTLVPK